MSMCLLTSLSSVASPPTSFVHLQPSLRGGAALVTDFEDQAADLIDFKKVDPNDTKAVRAANKLKKQQKKFKAAKKTCKDLSESECDDDKKCEFSSKKGKCGPKMKKPKFIEDEEDFYLDSSEDLFDFEEDYDWDEDSEDLFDSEDYDLNFEVDDEAMQKYLKEMKKFKKEQKKYESAMKEYKQADKAYKQAKKQCATFISRSVCGALNNDCVVKESSSGSTFKCNTTVSKPKAPKAPKEPKKPNFFEDEEDFYLDSSEDLFNFEEDYDWEM